MLHSAASTIPLVHCIHLLSPLLRERDQGTWGTALQEPEFGWGARRASFTPGSLRESGARLCAFLRLPTFPSVNYKECLNDFKGQAAAGVFSFLVPWPSELLFLSFFAINPRRQILEFP